MKTLFIKIYKDHFAGRGGMLELLPIAIPMFLSSMFDMLMMFIDRMFLSYVGVVHQAAAMGGGITSWIIVSLFCGIIGYASALVAQYYGAKQKDNCVRIVYHALLLGIASYPLILMIALGISKTPVFSGHSVLEQGLELRYFWYMSFGSIFTLTRFTFNSFFSGIGKTKIIMFCNIAALFVNLIANWVLIFGHWGFPAMGLDGAAIGTLLASFTGTVIIAIQFFRKTSSLEWHTEKPWKLYKDKLYKLFRYGCPQGIENVIGTLCFMFTVSAFHSYGDDMAAATTICFNWDCVSFHPLLGLQVAVLTLVGQAMGQDLPSMAERTARSGFKLAFLFSGMMVIIFYTCTSLLISVFTPESTGIDYTRVREFAHPMLRLTGIYLMMDAVTLISTGTLRGAGDTFWCMVIHLILGISTAILIVVSVRYIHIDPILSWGLFVFCIFATATTFFTRYRLGAWKKLRIIASKK